VRHGGTQKADPNGEGLSNIRELEPWQAVAEDTDGGHSYLKTLPTVRSDRLGLVGFCWGGEMTFASATEVRGLEAVVVSTDAHGRWSGWKKFRRPCSPITVKKIPASTRIFLPPKRL